MGLRPRAAIDHMLAEKFLEARMERTKLVSQYGLAMLNALFLLNGGAVIGVLTFLGKDGGANYKDAAKLEGPIWAFVVGLGCAVLAAIAGFLAQQFYSYAEKAESQARIAHVQRNPAGKSIADQEAKTKNAHGIVAQTLAMALVVVSLGAFAYGAYLALAHAKQEAGRPPPEEGEKPKPEAGCACVRIHAGGELSHQLVPR